MGISVSRKPYPENPKTRVLGFLFYRPLITFLFGIICIAIGVALGIYDHNHSSTFLISFSYGLIKEFGFALVIAVAISQGIEAFARQEHEERFKDEIKTIRENVFSAMYGPIISSTFFPIFEAHVARAKFIRKNTHVRVTIFPDRSIIPKEINANTKMPIHVYVRYDQINLTGDNQSVPCKITVEKPWDQDLMQSSQVVFFKVDDTSLTPEQMKNSDDYAPDNSDYKVFETQINYTPMQSRTFHVEMILNKNAQDHLHWQTQLPTDGLLMEIDFPECLEIDSEMVHPDECCVEMPECMSGKIIKRSNGALFPANGFTVWWRPKKRSHTKASAQSPRAGCDA